MIRTKKRMTWCIVLVVLNVLFIWGNSLLVREVSSAISKIVGTILNWLFPGPASMAEGTGQGVLRKIAHFAEFFTLGMLLCWLWGMINSTKWKQWGMPALIGLLVACVDETIQIFVPGRGPGILDVVIDFSGVLLGLLLLQLIRTLLRKKNEQA